jgi:hypothetical protein
VPCQGTSGSNSRVLRHFVPILRLTGPREVIPAKSTLPFVSPHGCGGKGKRRTTEEMVRVFPPPSHVPKLNVNKKGEGPKSGRGNVCGRLSRFVLLVSSPFAREHSIDDVPSPSSGRELATGRKIAIKKIKVGQFKDGLDMSAVREVKYLRELHHPNIIEVRVFSRVHWQTSFDDRHSTLLRDDTMTLNDGLVLFSLFFF